jgi:hypothetical protein
LGEAGVAAGRVEGAGGVWAVAEAVVKVRAMRNGRVKKRDMGGLLEVSRTGATFWN